MVVSGIVTSDFFWKNESSAVAGLGGDGGVGHTQIRGFLWKVERNNVSQSQGLMAMMESGIHIHMISFGKEESCAVAGWRNRDL